MPITKAAEDPKQIKFNSLTGIYHLSRDKQGLSLLTSDETIVTDFPANPGFYGITRSIPKKYQGQNVDVKVLNVKDNGGNPVKFKTSNDSSGNLVITTGDPSIILYGSQTFQINYQTKGVINLNKANDEFLLNVTGRGWDSSFKQVNATLNIPASFQANLKSDPTCYLVLNDKTSDQCQIDTKKNNDGTVITSKAGPLAAHQALVIKLEFQESTFTNTRAKSPVRVIVAVTLAGLIIGGALIYARYQTKKTKQT